MKFPLFFGGFNYFATPLLSASPGSNELLTKPELIKSDCSLSLSITQQPSPARGLTETYTIATDWKVMCGKDAIGYKLPMQGCLLFCAVFKACPHIYQLYRQDVGRFLEEYVPFCFIKLCERVGYWGTSKCDLFTLAVCPGALNGL